jgi:hypothetical protein
MATTKKSTKTYTPITKKKLATRYGNIFKGTPSSTGIKNSNKFLTKNIDTKSRMNLMKKRKV